MALTAGAASTHRQHERSGARGAHRICAFIYPFESFVSVGNQVFERVPHQTGV
jgi:hypothetical protein